MLPFTRLVVLAQTGLIQSTRSERLCSLSPVLHHRYAIDRRTDMDHLFNVHPGNGSVFLLKSLDREESAWHNISVIATELRKSRRGQGCRKMCITEMKAMCRTI